MKLLELDAHPLIEAFRLTASEFKNAPNKNYHLLLPPEYNIPGDMMNPLLYLFYENEEEQGIFIQYGEGTYQLKIQEEFLFPLKGFDHDMPCEILQTTPCTTTNGFSFDMHEITMNPFIPSPIPPLCNEIKEGFNNPSNAINFLKYRIRAPDLPAALSALENTAMKTNIGVNNREEILMLLHDSMDKISDLIFNVKPFHFIPTIFKMRTNYIVFYAVTGLFHSKLLKAYHDSYVKDNIAAQKAVHDPVNSIGDPAKLNEAAQYLKNLNFMNSVHYGITMITKFFNCVLESLPDKNAAADDILPAVCDGISRCTQLSSHIASTFQYLAEVWPSEGLDERTTYILVTCSIAASHFASGPSKKVEVPELKAHTIVVQKTTETINLLEDLLLSLNE